MKYIKIVKTPEQKNKTTLKKWKIELQIGKKYSYNQQNILIQNIFKISYKSIRKKQTIQLGEKGFSKYHRKGNHIANKKVKRCPPPHPH